MLNRGQFRIELSCILFIDGQVDSVHLTGGKGYRYSLAGLSYTVEPGYQDVLHSSYLIKISEGYLYLCWPERSRLLSNHVYSFSISAKRYDASYSV
jgi:hypothetical protein